MKLIFVRHGETDWVKGKKYQGSTDIPLNATGFKQAKAVGEMLKKERPLVVYSSQMLRAYETARAIADECSKKVIIDNRLREVCFGSWEGETHHGIRDRFPEDSRKWYEAKWTSRPPGGESLRSLKKRVNDFLADFKTKHSQKGSYVIVSHGGPIRMFLISLLNIPPQVFWNIRIDTASVSILNIRESAHREEQFHELALLNHQGHMRRPRSAR